MGYLVYKHTSPSGKVYIGITSKTAFRRWNNGRGYLGSVFYNAIRKYGWNNIKHEILYKNLTQQEAVSIEHDLILQYDSTNKKKGYNVVPGGGLGIKGYKFTEEQKKKLSESHKGKKYTEAQREALEKRRGKPSPLKGKKRPPEVVEKNRLARIEWNKTHTISEETREKLRRTHGGKNHWNYGRKYSEEHRKKLSLAHIGQKPANARPVICLETKEIFESASAAENEKGYGKDTIGKVCRGYRKTVKETHWMYIDDYNSMPLEEISGRLSHKGKCKKVKCVETGEIFSSARKASERVGCTKDAVAMCCRGICNTVGGFHWEYVKEVT